MNGVTREIAGRMRQDVWDRITAAMAAPSPEARLDALNGIWTDGQNTGLVGRRMMVECMMARLAGYR
jgi:hypothetical protein